MNKVSTTQIGLVTIVAGYFLVQNNFSQACANEIITNGGVLVTAGWAWFKRYQVGDINIFGIKKTPTEV